MPTLHIAQPVDPRFILDPFEPAYFSLTSDEIQGRVEAGLRELADCCACPRNCHVNRMANETKICHTGRYARVASALPHFGEEDCLRGRNGSGTIFFSLCNLRCVFCQNWDISQRSAGSGAATPQRIADIMLDLQAAGCHNINFVTPEHVVPQVLEAMAVAIPARPAATDCLQHQRLRLGRIAASCSTASWTSTCPISSSGSAKRPNGWPRHRTTRNPPARPSRKCTARSGP